MQADDVPVEQAARRPEVNTIRRRHPALNEVPYHIPLEVDQQNLNQGNDMRPRRYDEVRPMFNEGYDLIASRRFRAGWAKVMEAYTKMRGFGDQARVWEHCMVAVFVILFVSFATWLDVMFDAYSDTGIFREIVAFPGFMMQSITFIGGLLRSITRYIYR